MARVGPYRIVSEAGSGPISSLSIAEGPGGNPVSIRSIRLADVRQPDLRKELARELHVAATMLPSLRHPNAEAILEVIDAGDQVHFVSERIDAPPLGDSLSHHDLAARVAGLAQLAAALEQARRVGIVHGAVWPQHILALPGPVPRWILTQFLVGRLLARFIDPANPLAEGLRYSSPEQVLETTLTAQSDQFSLAVIAYECLAGAKPFDARQLPTVFFRICKEEPRPATDLNPRLKPAANDVLSRALAKRPDQRYASAVAFVDALRQTLEIPVAPPPAVSRPVTPVPATPPRPAPRTQPATPESLRSAPLPPAPLAAPILPPPSAPPPSRPVEDEPPVPPPALLPRTSASPPNSRVISVAVVALLVIVGAIWVDRSRTSDQPVPVQQADPSHAPAVPPPKDDGNPDVAAKPEPAATPTPPPKPEEAPPEGPKPSTPSPSPAKKKSPLVGNEKTAGQSNSVRLLSIPPGAQIEVDQSPDLACTTPCTLDLSRGRHTLVATSSVGAMARKIFNVPDDHEVAVVLPMRVGTLLVSSVPPGALILIDGADRGNTPATLRLPPGAHQLTVISGSRRAEETVEIEGDQLTTRTFRW